MLWIEIRMYLERTLPGASALILLKVPLADIEKVVG